MKKYILSIIFLVTVFSGVADAQTTTYCILNGVGTHCPGIIMPPEVPGILSDGRTGSSDLPPVYAVPDDVAMSTGYNISTPVVPEGTMVNGAAYSANMKDISARRRAYSATATGVRNAGSYVSTVYPNPVLSATRVVLNTLTSSPVTVDVVDANGNIVRTYDYSAGIYNLDVDMSGLQQGIYSVRVYGKDISFTNLKIVKL